MLHRLPAHATSSERATYYLAHPAISQCLKYQRTTTKDVKASKRRVSKAFDILNQTTENTLRLRDALDGLGKKILIYAGTSKHRWATLGDIAATVNRMKNASYANANAKAHAKASSNVYVSEWTLRKYECALESSKCDLTTIACLDERLTMHMAASCIQDAWLECVSNPAKLICRRRLLREFQQMEHV